MSMFWGAFWGAITGVLLIGGIGLLARGSGNNGK